MGRQGEAMHTLLLRLAGPMQSWGTQSRFLERDTGLEPSKSGVVGLLCAALGRSRDVPVDDLATLAMGVRVDREGVMQRDYHTALEVAKADGSKAGTVVSNRYFLADADFLVGLTGDDLALLTELDAALATPRWPLSLGRKAFPPGHPVRVADGGVRPDRDLAEALCREPWRPRAGDPRWWRTPDLLRVVLETTPSEGHERRLDQPGPGAAFLHRRFLPRHVLTTFWPVGDGEGAVPLGEATDV
jgi:CRISPR system Cascade subunit CasD